VTLIGYRLHVVSMESPGCKGIFEKVLRMDIDRYKAKNLEEWKRNVECMDITVMK